jgi:hypothetical protein
MIEGCVGERRGRRVRLPRHGWWRPLQVLAASLPIVEMPGQHAVCGLDGAARPEPDHSPHPEQQVSPVCRTGQRGKGDSHDQPFDRGTAWTGSNRVGPGWTLPGWSLERRTLGRVRAMRPEPSDRLGHRPAGSVADRRRYEQPGMAAPLPPAPPAASWSRPHSVLSETSQLPLAFTALPDMPPMTTWPFSEIE